MLCAFFLLKHEYFCKISIQLNDKIDRNLNTSASTLHRIASDVLVETFDLSVDFVA